HAERPSRGRFALVVGLFVLGLMSKPMLVTLPCVPLLLDAWPLGRTRAEAWAARVREKAVLFVLAAAASTATYLAQRSSGAVAPQDVLTLPVRASNALVSCLRYLQKTV